MAPVWVCLEGSQPATKQWTIDFMDGAQCLHFHSSIMQWTGCNCFAMQSHTYDTHNPRGFLFSLRHGYKEKGWERKRIKRSLQHRSSMAALVGSSSFSLRLPFSDLDKILLVTFVLQVKVNKAFIFSFPRQSNSLFFLEWERWGVTEWLNKTFNHLQ